MEEPKIEAIEPCSFLIGYVIVYITLYMQSTSKFWPLWVNMSSIFFSIIFPAVLPGPAIPILNQVWIRELKRFFFHLLYVISIFFFTQFDAIAWYVSVFFSLAASLFCSDFAKEVLGQSDFGLLACNCWRYFSSCKVQSSVNYSKFHFSFGRSSVAFNNDLPLLLCFIWGLEKSVVQLRSSFLFLFLVNWNYLNWMIKKQYTQL